MEKHTAYFNLLDQLKRPGCPVCAQALESVKSFLDSYLYEGVTDGANWDRLTESGGYCARHARVLEGFSDGLAVSLFYAHLLRRRLKELASPARRPWWGRRPGPAECPACGREREAEQGQQELLRRALGEAEFWAAWRERGEGLCLPHLAGVLEGDFPRRGALLELEAARLESLAGEMDEFVRKSEYRSTEKMGPEGDAWKRALRGFGGILY